jgi:hypothetical protein
MHFIRSFKGKRKSLFVFYTNDPCYSVPGKGVFVVLFVQVQYLLNQNSFLEGEPVYLVIEVIDEYPCPVREKAVVDEGDCQNVVALFVSNIELVRRGVHHRSN